MSPLIVSLRVPYDENESKFLLQAVEAAVRTFRNLNADTGEVSSTKTAQEEPIPQLGIAA